MNVQSYQYPIAELLLWHCILPCYSHNFNLTLPSLKPVSTWDFRQRREDEYPITVYFHVTKVSVHIDALFCNDPQYWIVCCLHLLILYLFFFNSALWDMSYTTTTTIFSVYILTEFSIMMIFKNNFVMVIFVSI